LRKRSQFPPFANSAKNGAPSILVMQTKIKAWATRQEDYKKDGMDYFLVFAAE